MKPSIEQLQNADRYELIDSFRIDEMAQFLTRERALPEQILHRNQRPKNGLAEFSLTGFMRRLLSKLC